MKKKIITAIILAALAVFTCLPALAADIETPVKLEGKTLSTSALVDGTTVWLPFRAICEALGYTVSWSNDGGIMTVSAIGEKDSVIIDVTHQKIAQNGHQLDAAVISGGGVRILSGRTYVHSGLFSSIFPAGASYDSKTSQITLRKRYRNDITITNETVASKEEHLVTMVQYPRLSGLKDRDVQNSINGVLRKSAQEALDRGQKNASDLAQAIRDGYTGAVGSCETFFDYMVVYNQNGLLSVVLSDYQYAGGAHGSTEQLGHTFDLATGRTLRLSDLMDEKTDYTAALNSAIRSEIDSRVAAGILYEFEFGPFEDIGSNPGFYLSDDGIVIFFQEYEYFPYSCGIQEFKINYLDLGAMLNETYRFLADGPVTLLPYAPNVLPVGDVGRVALDGNPTTGYSWHYAVSDENVLAPVTEEYTPAPRPGAVVGSGGTYIWSFKAIRAGEATITYKYYRSWEGESSAAPDNTVVYDVTVP